MLFLLVVCLYGFVVAPTFAKFTSNYTTDEDVVGFSFDFDVGISNIEEYEEISVDAKDYLMFNVQITNSASNMTYYGIWYKIISSESGNDVTISRLADTDITTSGSLNSEEVKTVTIIVINNSDSNVVIDVGVLSNDTSVDSIEYLGGRKLISGTASEPGVNIPNLDSGMIPVMYDEVNEVWVKAEYTNSNNSWYDYENKMWANAVLVSDSSRSNYQNANVGTVVADTDILAFYVWIPRFKYKVWNITRQSGNESDYAYSAYTDGIDIEFETSTQSTGNVECNYDITTVESEENLSDVCVYNVIDTIVTTSGNSNYKAAWYTHPAFVVGDEELTGFWIGKFETGGTAGAPVIKPDVNALVNQTLSNQFTTSRIFQKYGLSNNLDSHAVTNLEWGAVAYLTYSKYGLCSTDGCRDVYINNSSDMFTGRSGGAVSGSENLSLSTNYPDDTDDTSMYNKTGYYDYKGYFIDYSGNLTSFKDVSKIASTTGNIYGVYDMSGGAFESSFGNMFDSFSQFYTSGAGTNWDGVSILNKKYYNSYSYGTTKLDQIALNRSRLGDATSETIFMDDKGYYSWKSGGSNIGSYSAFVSGTDAWFSRGGSYAESSSGIFSYTSINGSNSSVSIALRSSLS